MRVAALPLVALPAALGLVPAAAAAQVDPFTFELRGGVAVPAESFIEGAPEPDPGASLVADFAVRVRPFAMAYLGFGQHRFGCPREGCDGDLSATGFLGGIRLYTGTGRLLGWAGGGVLSYRVEDHSVREPPGARLSRRAWGWEAVAGATWRVSDSFSLAPGVRYGSLEPEFREAADPEMGWIVADLGVVLRF